MKAKTKMKMIAGILFLMMLSAGLPAEIPAQEGNPTILASRIMDYEVYDKNNKQVGYIDDIVIRRSGRATQLIVGIGGFLGIGEKVVSLPFKTVRLEEEKIVLEATEKQLEQKSEFNYLAQGLRPEYYYRIRPYYYAPRTYSGPYPRTPRGYGYYGAPHGRTEREPSPPYEWAFSPSRFLASVVMNRRLINEEGRNIGGVKDLVINLEKAQVEKIVISSMEILGEDVYVALPYQPLGFADYGLVYDISPEQLTNFIFPYEE